MNAMTEILREIFRIQILTDIRRQQRAISVGKPPASRAEVDGNRAAAILAELIEEGLVTAPETPGDSMRLSPSGEDYLARLRRRDRPRPH